MRAFSRAEPINELTDKLIDKINLQNKQIKKCHLGDGKFIFYFFSDILKTNRFILHIW